MRRRWSAVLLLCLACLAWGAAKGEEVARDGFMYTIQDGQAVVTGFEPGVEVFTFYPEINGYPTVYSQAYVDGKEPLEPPAAKALILAEGITRVQDEQFRLWSALETIQFPSTLQEIGDYAFWGNDHVRELALPQGLTKIGISAFFGFVNLREVVIPEGVEELNSAFSECVLLEKVVLPNTMRELHPYGFQGCTALTQIEISDEHPTMRVIDGVLFNKEGTKLICFPAGKGGSYQIPKGTLEIGTGAFGWNGRLQHVSIPEGVTVLPEDGLYGLYALENLRIPASMISLEGQYGEVMLPGHALARIDVAEGNPLYSSRDGVLFKGDTLLMYPQKRGLSYDIPLDVKRIANGVFNGNRRLETLTFPPGLTALPDSALNECAGLRRVSLPIALERIGMYTFGDCISLEEMVVPPGVQSIGDGAFYNCTALRVLHIPASVTRIAGDALHGCSPDLVIYAPKGSEGHLFAAEYGWLWAEAAGMPAQRVAQTSLAVRQNPVAWVQTDSAEGTLTLHADAEQSGASLGQYPNGTTVEVVGEEGRWRRVCIGQAEGYMATDHLMMADPYTQVDTIQWAQKKRRSFGRGDEAPGPLMLYALPSVDEQPVREIGEEESLRVVDAYGGWLHIKIGHETGYVLVQYVNVASKTQTDFAVVTNPNARDRLHLRMEASVQSASQGRYYNGTQVQVLAWDDEWCKVYVDGKTGYMMSIYLTRVQRGEGDGESLLSGNG